MTFQIDPAAPPANPEALAELAEAGDITIEARRALRKTVPHYFLPEGTLIAEHGAMLMVRYTRGSGNLKSTQMILAFGRDVRPAKLRGAKKGKSRRGVIHCLICDSDLETEPEDGIWATREIIAHVRSHDRRKKIARRGLDLLGRVWTHKLGRPTEAEMD